MIKPRTSLRSTKHGDRRRRHTGRRRAGGYWAMIRRFAADDETERGPLRKLHVKIAKRGSNQIPMSPRVIKALKELGPKAEGPVFPPRRASAGWQAVQEAGDSVERAGTRQALADGLRAAGIDPKGVGFHTFRHTFLSLVARLPGAFYSIVRDLARHGARSVTDRYIGTNWDGLRRALIDLEGAVYGTNILVFPQATA